MKRPRPTSLAAQADSWNAHHPMGTAVTVFKDDGSAVPTVTTSEAYIMSGHTVVIHLRDISGCYALNRVRVMKVAGGVNGIVVPRETLDLVREALDSVVFGVKGKAPNLVTSEHLAMIALASLDAISPTGDHA